MIPTSQDSYFPSQPELRFINDIQEEELDYDDPRLAK